MGGILKVIIRFNDGSIVADTFGTNALSWWVCHPKTIRGDDSVLRLYTEVNTMWNTNNHTFEPAEYGVYVVDFQTRTIISVNDYTDCRSWLVQNAQQMAQRFGVEKENSYEVFEEMLRSGYISLVEVQNDILVISDNEKREMVPNPKYRGECIPLQTTTVGTWDRDVWEVYSEFSPKFRDLPWQERDEARRFKVRFDFPGWTFESTLSREVPDQERVRVRLRELGFPISEADEAAFSAWRAERLQFQRENEEEDEPA